MAARSTDMHPLRVVILLGLAGGTAFAAEAPAAPVVFETYLGETLAGTETVSASAPGAALTSRTELSVGGAKLTFVQEAKLDATGRRLVAYRCDVETPQGPGHVAATLGDAGWTLAAGTSATAEPAATKTFPAGASTIILDNNLASHLDLLCRDLLASGGESASYTALVPQVLASAPLQAKIGRAHV